MRSSRAVWAVRVGAVLVALCGLVILGSPAMAWVGTSTALDLARHDVGDMTSSWWGVKGWFGEARRLYLGAGFAYLCGVGMIVSGAVSVLVASRPRARAIALVALVSVPLVSLLLANGADGSPALEEQGAGASLWLWSSLAAIVVAVVALVLATRRGAGTSVRRRMMPLAVVTLVAGLVVLGLVFPPDPGQAPSLWPGVIGVVLAGVGASAVFVVTRCSLAGTYGRPTQ